MSEKVIIDFNGLPLSVEYEFTDVDPDPAKVMHQLDIIDVETATGKINHMSADAQDELKDSVLSTLTKGLTYTEIMEAEKRLAS